jgi:hypothetical protein
VIALGEVFVHCPRAIAFGDIWNLEKYVDRNSLPTLREILETNVKISSSKRKT